MSALGSPRASRATAGHGFDRVEFHSRARESDELALPACKMRWARFQLSDGSFVRLVETIAAKAPGSIHGSTFIGAHSR